MKSFFREIDSDLGNEVNFNLLKSTFFPSPCHIGDEGKEWDNGGSEEIRLRPDAGQVPDTWNNPVPCAPNVPEVLLHMNNEST